MAQMAIEWGPVYWRAARRAAVAKPELRLTRRGRLLVTVLLAAVGLTSYLTTRPPTPTPAMNLEAASVARQVVVTPGETLWQVAARAEPGADPRVVVDEIIALNRLPSATLRPGEVLDLPGR